MSTKYLLGRTKAQQVSTWISKHSSQTKSRLQVYCTSEELFEPVFSFCDVLPPESSSFQTVESITHHQLVKIWQAPLLSRVSHSLLDEQDFTSDKKYKNLIFAHSHWDPNGLYSNNCCRAYISYYPCSVKFNWCFCLFESNELFCCGLWKKKLFLLQLQSVLA